MTLTAEEKATVKRLWNYGESSSRICDLLNAARGTEELTRNMIIGYVNRARERGEPFVRRIFEPAKKVQRRKRRALARQKPPQIEAKPTPPKSSGEGEYLGKEPGAQHLYRAHGQLDVPFIERRVGQCAWPGWGGDERTGTVCGLPTEIERSYCKFHHGVGWRKV